MKSKLFTALTLMPALANAHPGHPGHEGELIPSLLHPFSGTGHLLAALAAGMLATMVFCTVQQAWKRRRRSTGVRAEKE